VDKIGSHEILICTHCNTKLRIPRTDKTIRVACPKCHGEFYHNLRSQPKKGKYRLDKKKLIFAGALVVIVAVVFVWQSNNITNLSPISGKIASSARRSSNWITILYGDLVDRAILTHNGESVGEVISRIPQYDDEYKGFVQPFLEPFSILCHDVLLSATGPDNIPLVNILSHYPIGSEQPAWTALFREGHYQLYYNHQLIRVFIKGGEIESALEEHSSVIRHAIRDVISSPDTTIEKIQVYVFNNDYATTQIKLNSIPIEYSVNNFDLSSRRKTIDLSSIEDFLNEGVILEAIEVDSNNDLFFYGRKASAQTLAGSPVSLSDVAVVYRSIFHYGFNSPYISLDNHEDNRYAKVNFGGNFENTHVGHVVLEADKLFKTLSTGLDPNTHKLVRSKVRRSVPDFLTEDERQMLESSNIGNAKIRYWFYPDEIGTVTDGSIGAILSHQFLADVERMDTDVKVGNAVKATIDHLNKNFSQYEKAFPIFKKLTTVGRIMALVIWLEGMDIINKIELDDFLSVRIPAFTTEDKTKKMLAVTAISYSEYSNLTAKDVRDYSKVYYISNLIDHQRAYTSDKEFLEIAGEHFGKIDISEYAVPEYNKIQTKIATYEIQLKGSETRIEAIQDRIKRSKSTLNRNNSREVNRYNSMVEEYNNLLKIHQSNFNEYNALINKLNSQDFRPWIIASVGGGINLRPKSFKRISKSKTSPKMVEVNRVKGQLQPVGKIAKAGNWIRSFAGKSEVRINNMQTAKWIPLDSPDVLTGFNYRSKISGDTASVVIALDKSVWKSEVIVNGTRHFAEFKSESKSLQVMYSEIGISGTGKVTSDGKQIIFSKK